MKVENKILPNYHPFFWFGAVAITFAPKVYIKKSWFEKENKYSREFLSAHENVHVKQQFNSKNKLIWFLKYIFNKKFRYSQEFEAYLFELRLKAERFGIKPIFLVDDFALRLSSTTYFGMVDYKTAKTDLTLHLQ